MTAWESSLFADLVESAEIRAIFEPGATIRRYLDVEIALAEVQAGMGIIPLASATAIGRALRGGAIDEEKFRRDLERVGFPIVPLLEQIEAMVPDGHGEYVHWGATTQDIMDTALVLQIRDSLGLIRKGLMNFRRSLAIHADRHRSDIMIGRSQLQHALPITFGLKAATWLSMFQRHEARLDQLEERLCVVQLGGAVGTLAALGPHGEAVQRAFAEKLGLGVSPTPWHTARDSLAEAVTVLANLAASLGKLGQDIVLLAQSDVAEVRERAAPGRGVSSTMPQKRNPVSSQLLTAIASAVADRAAAMLRASVHDHERASRGWMQEWRIVPEAFVLTGGALDLGSDLVDGLEVDTARMRTNVEASTFLLAEAVMMALAPELGRHRAHDVVSHAMQTAVNSGVPFKDAVVRTPGGESISEEALERALRPDEYLGAAHAFIDRVLTNERPVSEGESGQ